MPVPKVLARPEGATAKDTEQTGQAGQWDGMWDRVSALEAITYDACPTLSALLSPLRERSYAKE